MNPSTATYMYNSFVSSYIKKYKTITSGTTTMETPIQQNEYDAADYTKSVRARTPWGSIGLYNTGSKTGEGSRGIYAWASDYDANITDPGWIIQMYNAGSDGYYVKIPKTLVLTNQTIVPQGGLAFVDTDESRRLLIGYSSNDNYTNFTRVGNTSYQMSLYTSSKVWRNGSTTTYFSTASTSSDERLKERVSDMSKYEEFFTKINPFAFKYHDGLYNAPTRKPLITWGYSAQETIKAFGECGIDWEEQDLVVVEDAELDAEEAKYIDDGKLLKMTYQNMIPLNTHMIQKVMEENTQLRSRIADLEAKMDLIMSKLDITE